MHNSVVSLAWEMTGMRTVVAVDVLVVGIIRVVPRFGHVIVDWEVVVGRRMRVVIIVKTTSWRLERFIIY